MANHGLTLPCTTIIDQDVWVVDPERGKVNSVEEVGSEQRLLLAAPPGAKSSRQPCSGRSTAPRIWARAGSPRCVREYGSSGPASRTCASDGSAYSRPGHALSGRSPRSRTGPTSRIHARARVSAVRRVNRGRGVGSLPNLFWLVAASAGGAGERNLEWSLRQGVPVEVLEEQGLTLDGLAEHARDGRLHFWGTRASQLNLGKWERLEVGDVALTIRGIDGSATGGEVVGKARSRAFAERVRARCGEPWECLIFLGSASRM